MPGPPTRRKLRVGLALTFLSEQSGGVGRYARELIPALIDVEPDIALTAFVSRELPASVTDAAWADSVRWVHMPLRPTQPGPLSALTSLGGQWAAIPAIAGLRDLDVIHGLANVVAPVTPRVARVVTLHDLIWLRHPTTMGLRGTLGLKLAASLSARRATRVISVSAATRDDLVTSLGIDAAKIDVVPNGVRMEPVCHPTPAARLRERLRLGDGPVLLAVGQVRRHKNPAGLIRALAELADTKAHAVFAGERSDIEPELRGLAAELGVRERVHFTGWVSDADLEGLYALATCLVMPSFDEGFGLPVLEAMSRGLPVACSNASSLPEVAGDAALLFDARDPRDIAHAIERMLAFADLRAQLATNGLGRCRQFSWKATARGTIATYHRALEAG